MGNADDLGTPREHGARGDPLGRQVRLLLRPMVSYKRLSSAMISVGLQALPRQIFAIFPSPIDQRGREAV